MKLNRNQQIVIDHLLAGWTLTGKCRANGLGHRYLELRDRKYMKLIVPHSGTVAWLEMHGYIQAKVVGQSPPDAPYKQKNMIDLKWELVDQGQNNG